MAGWPVPCWASVPGRTSAAAAAAGSWSLPRALVPIDLDQHACEGKGRLSLAQTRQTQVQHGSPARHSQFPENGCLAIIANGSGQSV